MLKEKKNLRAPKEEESLAMKMLMAVPRNLVYVFLMAIIIAFGGMIYVVYTEKDLSSFMTAGGYVNEHNENIVVHPLFNHFKRVLANIDDIPRIKLNDLTAKKFYLQYLTNNVPLLVEDGCASWPALTKWVDMEYLSHEFSGQSLMINRAEKNSQHAMLMGGVFGMGKRDTFAEFWNKTVNDTDEGKFFYYLRNEMIVNRNLQKDIQKPTFLSKILRNRLTGLTIWRNFNRKPEFKDRERYICVLKGQEELKIVSPLYKQEIYSGVLEEYLPHETPLNFFSNVNNTRYPLFEQAKVLSVTVNKGQCVFVPAFYWMQSSTKGDGETIMVTFEYESHSELVSLLFHAIDQGILEE